MLRAGREIERSRGSTMSDRILERTAILLERYIADISTPDDCGIVEALVPGSHRPVYLSKSEVPQLICETRNILQAQAFHARHAPRWAIPLPVGDEISPLLRSSSGPLCLLAHYSCSLRMADYNYTAHPSLSTFGCGVMAHPKAPDHIRDDPELQAEFPAKELPGLSAQLIWSGADLPRRVRVGLTGP